MFLNVTSYTASSYVIHFKCAFNFGEAQALFSMDALAAIITPQFVESKWADQEVGIAMGRNMLVIPVMREATPHGFIGKFQAVNGNGKSVAEVARAICDALLSSNQTRSRLLTCLVI